MPFSDYIALIKPRIILLLVFTAVASYLLGLSRPFDSMVLASLVIAGALASGGSMAINDYLERNIDARIPWLMKRRPVAAGRLPGVNAIMTGITLVLLSAVVSILALPLLSAFFILSGVVFYAGFYTLFLKRRHWLNVVVGGFSGSFASLAGWTAGGELNWYGWAIALLIFIWTPGHFWSLALRYRDNYAKAGIPMLPDLVTEREAGVTIFANVLLTVAFSMVAFVGLTGIFYYVAAGVVNLLVVWATYPLLTNPDPKNAWRSFKASAPHLYLILVLLLLDRLYSVGF